MLENKWEVKEGNEISLEFDVAKTQNEIMVRVQNSPDVQRLVNKVDVTKPETVMAFGKEASESISKFADRILSEVRKSSVEDSGVMLKKLTGIMKKFDVKDFEDKKVGFFEKLFKRVSNEIEKLLAKYQTMDKEIEGIYVEIKKYESEIKKANEVLDHLFNENIKYYEELEKHIVAGKWIVEKVKTEWLPELAAKAQSGDPMDQQRYNNALDFLELMDQRVYDLEMAKAVALQTAPQIKLIQKGNYNLLRKINSAFVVTLPVFKTGLIQAITMKRQKIQAEAMKALDDVTNEMLIRNAERIAQNSIDITRLSGSSSIQIETLEKTYQTIMQGIDETLRIEAENLQVREQSRSKLEQLQEQLKGKRY